MRQSVRLIKFEAGRHQTRMILAVVLIMVLLSGLVLQLGINQYRQEIKQTIEFQNNEKKNLERFQDLASYGLNGILILSRSANLIPLFYNSGDFLFTEGLIDSFYKLRLNKPQTGKVLFAGNQKGEFDLAWVILIFGSMASLVWGFYAFRDKAYIKFLMNFASPFQVYLGIILARILILLAVTIIEGGVMIAQFSLNGIRLGTSDFTGLAVFLLMGFFLAIFFLFIGSIIGTFKKSLKGWIILFVFWIILSFIFPLLTLNVVTNISSNSINSQYSSEFFKLNMIIEQQKTFNKEIKKYKNLAEIKIMMKKLIDIYWLKGYKEIERLDLEMIASIERNARFYHLMSIFTPVTFYNSVNNEISSRGYNFIVSFYKYLQDKQKKFVRYYLDHVFDRDIASVEPFMKDSEYIFQARSGLPAYFWLGLLINLGYLSLSFFLSYRAFIKAVFPKPVDAEAFSAMDLFIFWHKHYLYRQDIEEATAQFFNIFYGKPQNYGSKILIDARDLVDGERKSFIYIPAPANMPGDMKAGALLELIIGLLKLPPDETTKIKKRLEPVLDSSLNSIGKVQQINFMLDLARLKKARIYILDDLFREVDALEAENICPRLKKEAELVIEFDPGKYPSHASFDHMYNVRKTGSMYDARPSLKQYPKMSK